MTESGSGFGFGILLNKFLKVSLVVLIGFLFRVCERVCDCVRARASVSFVVCTSTMIGHTFTFCYIRKKKAEFSNNWLFLKQINYCHQLVSLFLKKIHFFQVQWRTPKESPERVLSLISFTECFTLESDSFQSIRRRSVNKLKESLQKSRIKRNGPNTAKIGTIAQIFRET